MDHETSPETCAVIGAGMAGAAAAATMRHADTQVVVFEKARGAGGRTSTRRASPYAFDHGAQYFTAHDPRFRTVVAGWEERGVVAEWSARIAVLRNGHATPDVGKRRLVGVPGMSAVCKHALRDMDVRYTTRVAQVIRDGEGWLLEDATGAQLGRYDAVVVTAPPAQAAPLLAAAPALSETAAAVRMLPCWTVMAAFESPPEVSFEGAFVHDSPLGWVAHDSSKPGRPAGNAWVLQATPEWSTEHVDDTSDDVCEHLLDAFSRSIARPLQHLSHVSAHRWMYARTAEANDLHGLLDPRLRIAAAGDWCTGARVEAAYLSGLAAAEGLLADRCDST